MKIPRGVTLIKNIHITLFILMSPGIYFIMVGEYKDKPYFEREWLSFMFSSALIVYCIWSARKFTPVLAKITGIFGLLLTSSYLIASFALGDSTFGMLLLTPLIILYSYQILIFSRKETSKYFKGAENENITI